MQPCRRAVPYSRSLLNLHTEDCRVRQFGRVPVTRTVGITRSTRTSITNQEFPLTDSDTIGQFLAGNSESLLEFPIISRWHHCFLPTRCETESTSTAECSVERESTGRISMRYPTGSRQATANWNVVEEIAWTLPVCTNIRAAVLQHPCRTQPPAAPTRSTHDRLLVSRVTAVHSRCRRVVVRLAHR